MTAKEAQSFIQESKPRLKKIQKVIESAGLQCRVCTYARGRWGNKGPIVEARIPGTNRCMRSPLPVQANNDEGFAVFVINHCKLMAKTVPNLGRLQ